MKFWTRKKFKGTDALKRTINPAHVPIEEKESLRWLENVRQADASPGASKRCVHIGDRGADIYELFCASEEIGAKFLIRICVDRLAGDEGGTMEAMIAEVPVKGVHKIKVRDDDGVESDAKLELKYLPLKVRPPKEKQKRYPDLNLTLIHAIEKGTPKNREPIRWKLLTNLVVDTMESAVEKLDW